MRFSTSIWHIGLVGLVCDVMANPITSPSDARQATVHVGSVLIKRGYIKTECGPVEGQGVPSPSFDLASLYHSTFTVTPHACLKATCQHQTSTNVFICSDSGVTQNVSGADLYRAVNDIIDSCYHPGSFLAGTSTYDGFHIQVKRAGWCD